MLDSPDGMLLIAGIDESLRQAVVSNTKGVFNEVYCLPTIYLHRLTWHQAR